MKDHQFRVAILMIGICFMMATALFAVAEHHDRLVIRAYGVDEPGITPAIRRDQPWWR